MLYLCCLIRQKLPNGEGNTLAKSSQRVQYERLVFGALLLLFKNVNGKRDRPVMLIAKDGKRVVSEVNWWSLSCPSDEAHKPGDPP